MNDNSITEQEQNIDLEILNEANISKKFNEDKILDIIQKQRDEDCELEKKAKNRINKLYRLFKKKTITKLNNKKLPEIMYFLRNKYPHLNDITLQDFYNCIESKKLQYLAQHSLKNNNNDKKL